MKKYLIRLWRKPNPWITGVSFFYLSSISLTSASKGFEWVKSFLSKNELFSAIAILVLAISGLIIIRKILWYRIVPFDSQSILARFSPSFYILNWWRGKHFRKVHIEGELEKFNLGNNHIYSLEYPNFVYENGLSESRPTILFKIPARLYLPIPDFINLHLLHRLSIAGASVIVIITDILYSDKRIPNSAINFTINICKKILGNHTKVKQLSKICVNNSFDFAQFVIKNYADYLSMNEQRLTTFKQPNKDDKSIILRAKGFMSFGFFVFAISKLVKSKNSLFVMQWRERIVLWEDFSPLVKDIMEVNIKGLIVNESLRDHNNIPLLTGSYNPLKDSLFTMTDDSEHIANIIFKCKLVEGAINWDIPQSYFIWISQLIFGIKEHRNMTLLHNKYRKKRIIRIAKKFVVDQNLLEEICNNKLEELIIRVKFYTFYAKTRRLFGKFYL